MPYTAHTEGRMILVVAMLAAHFIVGTQAQIVHGMIQIATVTSCDLDYLSYRGL